MCSSSSIDDNQINLAKMCSNMHVVVDRDTDMQGIWKTRLPD